MPRNKFTPFQLLLLCSLFIFFGFLYFFYSRTYPYYFIWDMDQTTVIDILLMQKGMTPVHINHTGFGMYFILKCVHAIAHTFGQVSFLQMDDLSKALSPLTGVAELLTLLRSVSPFVILAGVATLWWAFTSFAIVPIALGILFLLIFATQSSLFYHATMIRSEIYAVVFWCFTLLFLVLAAVEKSKKQNRYILAAGFFLGLCYITKLQSIIYLFATPIFFLFFLKITENDFSLSVEWRKKLSTGNLIGFSALLIAAHFRSMRGESFVTTYPLNIIAIVFGSIIAALCAVEREKIRFFERFITLRSLLSLLLTGFFLSFLTHIFAFKNIATSWRYMLLDAKMLFFRMNYYENYNVQRAKNIIWPTFLQMLDFIPITVLVAFVFTGMLLLLPPLKRFRKIGIFLFIICLVNMALATRGLLRDVLWTEVLMNAMTISFSVAIWSHREKWRRGFAETCTVLPLLLLLGSQISMDTMMRTRNDAQNNLYGWKQERAFHASYIHAQLLYEKAMVEKYGNSKKMHEIATKQAMRFREAKELVQFSFPNQHADLTRVGVMEKNFPVWVERNAVLESIPAELQGSVVVDNLGAPTKHFLFEPTTVNVPLDGLEKFIANPKPQTLGVLTRSDLAVHLFLLPEAYAAMQGHPPTAKDLKIVVSEQGEKKTLYAVAIKNYTEISMPEVEGKGFFTITQLPRGI